MFVACLASLLLLREIFAFTPPSPPFARLRSDGLAPSASRLASSQSPSAYDVIIVGGGSAGLTAAKFAATFGKRAVLVESARMGGDCTWTGCVPSKTLLATAKRAKTWRDMTSEFGGGAEVDDASLRRMLKGAKGEVDATRSRIYEADDSPEVLQKLGIDVRKGRARFRDARSVDVTRADGTTEQLTAKYGVVVATGAKLRELTSDIPGLDAVPYWTYENVWDDFFGAIENNPRKPIRETRVVVVGGGPIGCELSQALSRLGCAVTLVSRNHRLLPSGEEEASAALRAILEGEGVTVICSRKVAAVSEGGSGTIEVSLGDASSDPIVGDHILVATGRVPNAKNMGLEEMGVAINPRTGGVEVNEKLETSVKGVFAAGDCTGDRQFTHYAGFQGAIAARNILLPLKDPGVLSEVPATTFTDPEVASFGLTEEAARAKHGKEAVATSLRPLSKVDRAVCEGRDAESFIKVIYKAKSKQILGATIVAPAAGELISELSVAKEGKVAFDALSTLMHPYPGYGIALQQMAADVYYDKLKKSMGLYDFLKKAGL